MLKKSRIKIFAMVMLATSSIFFFSPKPARAFFWDPYENMVETMLIVINNSMNTMTTTMLTISADIGTMADRILIMADNIGIMADRIVSTEQLMADLVRDVTDSQGPSSLLTSPPEGAFVNLSSPLEITLSNGSTDYVLYISNTADMYGATNILVEAGYTETATTRAADYATGNQLYIAVKAINGDTMGPISNTVMINLI